MAKKEGLTVQEKHKWRAVLYLSSGWWLELTFYHPHSLFPSAVPSRDHSRPQSDSSVYSLFFFLHLRDVKDEGCWAADEARLTRTCCVAPKKT